MTTPARKRLMRDFKRECLALKSTGSLSKELCPLFQEKALLVRRARGGPSLSPGISASSAWAQGAAGGFRALEAQWPCWEAGLPGSEAADPHALCLRPALD